MTGLVLTTLAIITGFRLGYLWKCVLVERVHRQIENEMKNFKFDS